MHVRGDLNCSRGYEWLVLAEAKKRNPAIRTYGLTVRGLGLPVVRALRVQCAAAALRAPRPSFARPRLYSHPAQPPPSFPSPAQWGVPGWIGDGNDTASPGNFYSQDNIDYHLSWLDCARDTWAVEVD